VSDAGTSSTLSAFSRDAEESRDMIEAHTPAYTLEPTKRVVENA